MLQIISFGYKAECNYVAVVLRAEFVLTSSLYIEGNMQGPPWKAIVWMAEFVALKLSIICISCTCHGHLCIPIPSLLLVL